MCYNINAKVESRDYMICPKCGTENKGDFCIKCGAMVKNNTIYQINTKPVSKDSLLEAYFGFDYNKIVMSPSNLAGAFFGPFYLAYRKCFLSGTILLISQIGLLLLFTPVLGTLAQVLTPTMTSFLLIVINFFFQGAITNPLIIHHANSKIKKIRKKYGPNKEIIAKAGKPDFVLAIIFILLIILFYMFFFYYYNTR